MIGSSQSAPRTGRLQATEIPYGVVGGLAPIMYCSAWFTTIPYSAVSMSFDLARLLLPMDSPQLTWGLGAKAAKAAKAVVRFHDDLGRNAL